jgi:hypothetical protein
MDGRRARLVEPVLDRIPGLQRLAPEAPTKARRATPTPARSPAPVERQLRTFWAVLLAVGWPIAFTIAVWLPPAPAHPHAAEPAWAAVASEAAFIALYATIFLASMRHRATAVAGVAAGLITVGMSASCPATGHHELGAWWFAQIAVLGAMLVASLLALRRTSLTPT